MENKITLLGEELNIAYNLATQITYEKITDKAFDPADLAKTENRLSLCYACIIVNNENTKITFEQILRELSIEDYSKLDVAVNQAITTWYKIPTAAHLDEETPEDEDSPKNA